MRRCYRPKAALESAILDEGFTRITAQIDGYVTRSKVDQGNLVGQGEPTLLAEVFAQEPIHVYFEIDERHYTRLIRERTQRIAKKDSKPDREVKLKLPDGVRL